MDTHKYIITARSSLRRGQKNPRLFDALWNFLESWKSGARSRERDIWQRDDGDGRENAFKIRFLQMEDFFPDGEIS